MATFFTLASSSAGNSSYIGALGCGILVDCGICCRSVTSGLAARGIEPERLSGILVTHEHVDHIRGLKVLLKRYNLPLYASAPVLRYLTEYGLVPESAELHEIDEREFVLGGMLIEPFLTSHDSVGSRGYRVTTPDEHRITVCTDTGFITTGAREHLLGSDAVLIESNYDKAMLMAGKYPYPLKKRIDGKLGHLSNADCAAFLPELVRSGATHIILGHLSKENNLPELAEQTSVSELSLSGMRRDDDYVLFAAPRSELSENILL